MPADVPVDPMSAAFAANMVEQIEEAGPGFSFREWSCPLYFASLDDPLQAFTIDLPSTPANADLATVLSKVPVPSEARPAPPWPGDNHMAIYLAEEHPELGFGDTYWEFWRASQLEVDGPHSEAQAPEVSSEVLNKPGWHCQAGCAIKEASKNQGFFDDTSWPGITGRTFGATASKLPFGGSLIRVAEAQRLYIPHAIAFSLLHEEISKEPRWPARRSDGLSEDPSAPEEGMCFFLPQSFDLSEVGDPFMRSVARSWKEYGMYLHDGSKTDPSIKCESQALLRGTHAVGTDAWKGPADTFGSKGAIFTDFASKLAKELPWSALEVVDSSYRPAETGSGQLGLGT